MFTLDFTSSCPLGSQARWRGLAVRIFPLVRSATDPQPRSIVIDPERGFGRPTLFGTGVRVEIIVERYRAGESPAELAADYRVRVDRITEEG